MRPAPLPRSAYAYERRITTRWADNDVYGHVNNALYYSFFDTTITGFLVAQPGLFDPASGPMLYVAASDCAYFRGFAFPEPIESALGVAAVGRTSITWRIGLFGEGEAAPRAQGRFVHVCMDRKSDTPAPWPQAWLAAFEAIRLTEAAA